ncbi:STAS domain-containing protein [Streptomyces sp. NPDC016845]|uniref:STAS domain-containing protein n=1 Tax=Streptomyces sp. NPDC016845 TaxID=3364972 RepID=UPI0037AE9DD2
MPDHADGAAPPAPPATHPSHPGPGARVRVRGHGTYPLVAVHGEVDLEAAPGWEHDLRSALHNSRHGIALDLRALRFCDCAGLNALLRVRRAALMTGKTVTIAAAGPAVTRLLHLTQTAALFTAASTINVPDAADPAGRPCLTTTVPALPPQPSRAAPQPTPQ